MLSYCLKCKQNTESINPRVSATRTMNNDIFKMCSMW